MTQTMIVKQADFIEGILSSVKDRTDFKNKPFETIFGLIGTGVLWRMNWMLGALSMVGEAIGGYGPSIIGKYIDDYLRKTKKGGEADLSDSNLQNAATHAAEQILGQSAKESESMLADIYIIKHSLSLYDFVATAYVSQYSQESGLVKHALGTKPGVVSDFKNIMLGRGMLAKVGGMLYWLLKRFSVGLIGIGLAGGLMSMMGIQKTKETPEAKRDAPSGESTAIGTQRYTNVSGSVEGTLITFLDAAIADFSTSFANTVGEPLKGSARMKRVLQEVSKMNWAEIGDIDAARVFMAPSPLVLAKMLFPVAKYEPIGKEEPVEKKVLKTNPAKSSAKAPKSKTMDPKAELRGLLAGVLK